LGGPLFEGGRKSRLTPLGAYVLERARRAISEYDAALLNIRHFARGEHGVASLAAVPSAATRLVPAAVAILRMQRPHARIDLRDIDSAAVVEAVANDEADFGIAGDDRAESGLVAELLLEDPFMLICPAGHPFAVAGRPVQWRDIDPAEFIANGICSRIASAELTALAAQSNLMLHNTTSLLGFVAQGFGITLLPALAAPESGAFRAVPLADGSATRRLNLLTRPGETLGPVSQALLESVREVSVRFASTFAN
jgi:LysR family carnitine catabolism transcriptional activator